METTNTTLRRVYQFGNHTADGNGKMKPLLGGKGANLAEMNLIGIPVPPGFTITTDVCTEYNTLGKNRTIELLLEETEEGIRHIERIMGTQFGNHANPCLLSVRSGARDSMPGMMDTVLDIGLNDEAVRGLAFKTGKERFAWDSYRRFIQMYGDVVMKVGNYATGQENPFEEILGKLKAEKNAKSDQDLSTDDFRQLVTLYKEKIFELTQTAFPQDPWEQLWNSILAVFESWHTPRAELYRKLNEIPEHWGTAVNVQAMVYGNMGDHSASGVAFTRDAATGENIFNGEYLIDAQGEDVVAGIRTPQQVTKEGSLRWAKLARISEEERKLKYLSLEEYMPEAFRELDQIQEQMERHFLDMQDLEFTVQEGKLWILQTRNGKRTGEAMVRIGMEMLEQGLIDSKTLLLRMIPNKLNELLHPIFDNKAQKAAKIIANGLPASPGAATGRIVFFSEDAENWEEKGTPVILVRTETSADDLGGMNAARGILTARGGTTSHAAVVARGMGKCCISGAGSIKVNYNTRTLKANGNIYQEGDWISLNGTTGEVFDGQIKTVDPVLSGYFGKLMEMTDKYAQLKVYTNADTPETAELARKFGAVGIGLCRTEHMFFQGDRIRAMREMILAEDEQGRRKALKKLLPMQRTDFEGIFQTMEGFPVTVRLLDPPLHEFVPYDDKGQQQLAQDMDIPIDQVKWKVEQLSEINPMLGHRGCRLGNTYPEITQMQARAIIEAALNLKSRGIKAVPEIMIPLTGVVNELHLQEHIVREEIEKIFLERNDRIAYKVGTMIEVPRAALIADKIAKHAEFFSFGTNDLTQMTFGYSRDDAAKYLPVYLEKNLLKVDPFQVLDQEGVGQLVKMGVDRGRSTNPALPMGICGEHGGEPKSIAFCHKIGMNYVSCSPYRIPLARLAVAQAAIQDDSSKEEKKLPVLEATI